VYLQYSKDITITILLPRFQVTVLYYVCEKCGRNTLKYCNDTSILTEPSWITWRDRYLSRFNWSPGQPTLTFTFTKKPKV